MGWNNKFYNNVNWGRCKSNFLLHRLYFYHFTTLSALSWQNPCHWFLRKLFWQFSVLHLDNFYFPYENNTTVNINSMKSNVATFYPRSHEGNDCYLCARLNGDYRFNLRSHEGNDSHLLRRPERPCVSIHVPTRGTTRFDGLFSVPDMFQSTFPRGERQSPLEYGVS